ncbi:MAG: hypothetical protein IKX76_04255, partial [Eubacterium sp.]|nr:hypothetical protein [Eubacterium sp.]
MFEFTLFKSLFFEMDKHKMKGVVETKDGNKTNRRLEVSYPNVPGIRSITSQERIMPMVDRYFFYVNDEELPVELDKRPDVRQVIYEFYKDHFPSYLKEGLTGDMTRENLLDCFEVFEIPDYRPKYAYPGLVNLEDLRKGLVHFDDKPKYAFPGLEMLSEKSKRILMGQDKPAVSGWKGMAEMNPLKVLY